MKEAYLKTITLNGFNYGKANGIIERVVILSVCGKERPCYEVYYDKQVDYVPVSDVNEGLYQIVSTPY